MGSSPRMRGALPPMTLEQIVAGIIPAYAGSTRPTSLPLRWKGDHPRVCGEHYAAMSAIKTLMGSSPRMRGAREVRDAHLSVRGIIPAYAGSTLRAVVVAAMDRDHPRVCGEHTLRSKLNGETEGSSPRMRGAPLDDSDGSELLGIIPAYAGSTPAPIRWRAFL